MLPCCCCPHGQPACHSSGGSSSSSSSSMTGIGRHVLLAGQAVLTHRTMQQRPQNAGGSTARQVRLFPDLKGAETTVCLGAAVLYTFQLSSPHGRVGWLLRLGWGRGCMGNHWYRRPRPAMFTMWVRCRGSFWYGPWMRDTRTASRIDGVDHQHVVRLW
jgi:hypothetical protein